MEKPNEQQIQEPEVQDTDDLDVEGIEIDTGDDEDEVGIDIDPEGGEPEEPEEEEATEEPDEEGDEPKPEPEEEKLVPLKALEAERKKWQERLNDPELKKALAIAERLKQTTGKDYDTIQKELDAAQVNRYVENGVDEQTAQWLVTQQREILEVKKQLNRQKRDAEYAALKNNPVFADAELYRDELDDYAERTGQTIKQAYMALRGTQRIADLLREVEQRTLNSIQKKQAKRVDTAQSGGEKARPKVNLSADEIEAAKLAGMTPQEYAALKKINSPDQYRKLKAKKK